MHFKKLKKYKKYHNDISYIFYISYFLKFNFNLDLIFYFILLSI